VAGDAAEAALLAVEGVRRAQREPTGWLLAASGEEGAIRERLLRVPGVKAVQVYHQSLEEIFLSHVQ
jgi:hypothetical protein